MTKIDVSDLNPADVLAVLYNASRPQGMGFLQYDATPMTHDEAEALLSDGAHFDYLKGRVMKISIEPQLDPWLYDRDNGTGAAQRAIDAFRKTLETNPDSVVKTHQENRRVAANEVLDEVGTKSSWDDSGSVPVFTLGLGDVAEQLTEAVDSFTGDSGGNGDN